MLFIFIVLTGILRVLWVYEATQMVKFLTLYYVWKELGSCNKNQSKTSLNTMLYRVSFSVSIKGVKLRCNGLLDEAKLYYMYLPQRKVYDKVEVPRTCIMVQSTINIRSMLMLGDLWACPPRKCLKNRWLNWRAFQSQNISIKCVNLKKQINCEIKGSSLTINIIITCTDNMLG